MVYQRYELGYVENIPADGMLECRTHTPTSLPPTICLVAHSMASFLIYLVFHRSVLQLLVIADDISSSLILVTLMMEAIHSSDTSILTRATRRNIPEDGTLQ
jgi:hypothetical protein